ncbi:uncharacterized protein LOC135814370 [Sycon ciliatum]|uniref:uncharacterized protein LOC135814370 n=1 Tax=Sycon ciliatum TaxID=27933 RepID=UPI0031F716B0
MAGMLRSREEALFLHSKKDGTMCRTVRVALNWSDEAAIAHTVRELPYGNSEVLLQYRYITPCRVALRSTLPNCFCESHVNGNSNGNVIHCQQVYSRAAHHTAKLLLCTQMDFIALQ